MSLCKRLHSWFRKQDKKVKDFEKGSQENIARDIYCPINFEKMLRNYDIPSQTQKVKKDAKVEVQSKKYSLIETYKEEQVDKQSKEDFNCFLNEREKQNDNKENFNLYNLIPEVIQNEKNWKLDQQQNLNILQDIKFKNDQLCESEIFSSPQKPFEVLPFHPIIPNNKEENYEKFLFEQVMPKAETKQNNYSDSNKSFQMQAYLNYIPELKTKLSIRTIENKIKKGYSLRKIANQLIHYKYYQFCKVNQNINFEELHELIMSFLKKKFPQSI